MSRQPDRPNPPLPDEVCGEIAKQLQLTLVELIALSLAGKQLQWTCYGRDRGAAHARRAALDAASPAGRLAATGVHIRDEWVRNAELLAPAEKGRKLRLTPPTGGTSCSSHRALRPASVTSSRVTPPSRWLATGGCSFPMEPCSSLPDFSSSASNGPSAASRHSSARCSSSRA